MVSKNTNNGEQKYKLVDKNTNNGGQKYKQL
jgi:hypothetical protein